MDKIIPLVTALFMLSMISERIAEFFKNYLSRKKIKGYEIIGDATTKYPEDSPAELRRHYRILKLNLVCGFVTALLCHASFFDFLQNMNDPGRMLKWPATFHFTCSFKVFFSNLFFLLGCFFTGAFISLGSKFWHDLLDILLAVKNAKKSIDEAISQGLDFNSLSGDEKFALVSAAIKENKESWKNSIKNYRGVSIAEKLVGKELLSTKQLSIRFNVSKKEELPEGAVNAVPVCVFYKGYKIPTDVLETGEATAMGNTIDPGKMPRPLGSSIGRAATNFSGTLGISAMLTIDGVKHYCGLSCYHVLFPEELKKKRFLIESSADSNIIQPRTINSPSRIDHNPQFNIGLAAKGKFTDFVDIGFFTTDRDSITDKVMDVDQPAKLHDLKKTDEGTLQVKICGRTSGMVTGTVFAVSTDPYINYFKNDTAAAFTHELKGLIQVKMKAAEGDSGSAVLTVQGNELVGILVACDTEYSYVIPVDYLKSNFDIEFNLQTN